MNRQSKYTEKWQKANGYVVKSFKMKKDIVVDFEKACKENGESQAAVITHFMNEYVGGKKMETKYYLFEKNAHGGLDYTKYTLEEIRQSFAPSEMDSEEYKKAWECAKESLFALKDFIESCVNNCDGEHYHDYYIEEA